ncbi:MAG: phosphatidate cytidylyltransferase [Defluviitaleaceae bacterium]|nr:phosphatidate cytidylyltransferase [Defluviitaleaceae bacterium]
MVRRVITSVVGLPLLVFVLISGGVVLEIALFCVAAFGVTEFYKATTGRDGMWSQFFIWIAVFAYFFFFLRGFWITDVTGIVTFLAILIMAYGVATVVTHKTSKSPSAAFAASGEISSAAPAVAGLFYVALMLGFVILVREAPGGIYLVWLIFISAWGADTFAYFVGKAIGRHKLCPALSPSKTVEGAVGGVVGAAVTAMLYGRAISHFFPDAVNTDILLFGIVAAFSAVMSIFGDLTASSIKRKVRIKDFGKIFPGHGGVLDRFDSVLFTAPTIYILLNFL